MKWNPKALTRLPALLERYKYPALILLAGLALMLWPSGKGEAQPQSLPEPVSTAETQLSEQDYRAQTERELEQLLSQIQGAGRVQVMLTLKTGPSQRYQTDRSQSQSGEEGRLSWEEKTVILNRGSAYNEPALVSTAYPEFQGALVVAEGGDLPTVRYQLSAALAALLDLGADQITVVKMK